MTDWKLFVEIAKRMGAGTSRNSHTEIPSSVNLNGIFISYDKNESRAYYCIPKSANRSMSWLDNNILVWIDTLRGEKS